MNKEGEPSVEDILRSIKQVISREDEGAQGETRSASAPAFGNNPFARRDAFTRPAAVTPAANAPETPADPHEVYDLAALPDGEAPAEPEAVAPDETVSLPSGFQVHRYESAAAWHDGDADDVPLTLSTLITPEGDVDFAAGDGDSGEEEAEAPRAAPEPEEAPRPEATKAPAPESEGLLAGAAAAAVRAQLSALDNLSASAPKAKAADNPLEDMVKEMLRPMLKDWLDANLQTIIERMVQDEIARITGRR